ncbi:hypothetical protein OEM_28130 [Mycobacterium intracellulare subsp. yongonense 05-1390]|nr:hypothetical protein OEM_28130 [Mycobacterium intracellulare subsp. yongonense 05-1390]
MMGCEVLMPLHCPWRYSRIHSLNENAVRRRDSVYAGQLVLSGCCSNTTVPQEHRRPDTVFIEFRRSA